MEKTTMLDLYRGENKVFRVGESHSFSFDAASLPQGGDPADYRLRLFIKGEPCVDAHVLSEWGGGLFLRDIDDSLSDVTHHSRYSIRFQPTDEIAPRRAYYKLLCDNLTYPGGLRITQLPKDDIWHFSFWTKAVDFCPLGEAEVRAEIYYAKAGRSPQDILDDADEVISFPIKSGTYDFCKTEGEIRINRSIAAILFTVSVGASKGELFLEDVGLRGATDISVLPGFNPSSGYSTTVNWFGENLTHHEWSRFEIYVNGTLADTKNLFSSIYRYAENEFPIDSSLFMSGENTVTLKHVSDYFHPAPYQIIQLSLMAEKKRPFHIVACPHVAVLGEVLAVTVETEVENLKVEARTSTELILPCEAEIVCREIGLDAILFDVKGMTGAVEISLTADGYTETCTVARTVLRGQDGVLCGTGDDVYIAQSDDAKREYLKWYLSNECGSFITFRPTYHWSSTKTLQSDVWRKMVPFLNKQGLWYCVLFDERELLGLSANPTLELLEGPRFMGYQGHERDGAFYYWGNEMWGYNGSFYWELRDRRLRHPDVSYRVKPQYDGRKVYVYRNPNAVHNVREAVDRFEKSLAENLRGFKRHTGVTMLFRHFAKAGIEVLGAETMYANHEILLSGLRGSAYAYSKPETGAHLALQWHVEPVGRSGFFDRYALSLNLSYMHGVSHINTEEGLWRMEHGFESHDRFSDYCQQNVAVKRKFLRFLQTHTRAGAPAHRHGVLYGNAESAVAYHGTSVWNKDKEGWEIGAPEEAWELIHLIYPDARIPSLERIQRIQTEQPQGWFSRTPYGLAEVIPVEAPLDKLSAYPYLNFIGYNLATGEQLAHLLSYVKNGGTLLLTLAHLSTDDERPRLREPDFGTHLVAGYEALTGFAIDDIVYDGYRRATADWSGVTVKSRNANGEPLVVEHCVGDGKVILVNTYEYPGHEAVKEAYLAEWRALADAVKAEDCRRGGIEINGNPVQYAIYDLPQGGRRIYLANVAWYGEETVTEATLCLGDRRYSLPIVRGEIGIVNIFGDLVTYTCDATTEVLSLDVEADGIYLHVQGEGDSTVLVLGTSEGVTELEVTLEGEARLKL